MKDDYPKLTGPKFIYWSYCLDKRELNLYFL